MPKQTFIMGVDPGLDGGICILADDGNILLLEPMPTKEIVMSTKRRKRFKRKDGDVFKLVHKTKREVDIKAFADLLAKYEPDIVYIEGVSAMPGQGVTSMFNFGFGYGMIVGLCRALEGALKTVMVLPQAWQKLIHQERPKGSSAKDYSAVMAERLYPGQCGGHDGKIDALLIAEFGRRALRLN